MKEDIVKWILAAASVLVFWGAGMTATVVLHQLGYLREEE